MEQSAPTKSVTNTIQIASQKSAERISKMIKGVAKPYTCIHQAFTFPEQVFDLPTAKRALKKVLDVIHNRFEAASIYIFERQGSGSWHVHILFFFFGGKVSSPAAIKAFGKEAFKAWQRIHKGKCNRSANLSKEWTIIGDYLLKSVEAVTSTKREEANWWGYRNKRLLSAHRGLPPPKVVRWKPFKGQLTLRKSSRSEHLEQLKQKAKESGISWAAYKRGKLKTQSPVTDKQFLDFLELPEDIFF